MPELVEKKEPPMITIIKNKNHKFGGEFLKDILFKDTMKKTAELS